MIRREPVFVYGDRGELAAVIQPSDGQWRLIVAGRVIGVYPSTNEARAALDRERK